jgi:hypothetical protein
MARSARNVLVVFGCSPNEIGGAGRHTALLVDAFIARGWRVVAIYRRSIGTRPIVTRTGSLLVIDVPGFEKAHLGALAFLAVALPVGIYHGFRGAPFLAVQLASQSLAAAICRIVTRRPAVVLATPTG